MTPALLGLGLGAGLLLLADGLTSPPLPKDEATVDRSAIGRQVLVVAAAAAVAAIVWFTLSIAVLAVGAAVVVLAVRWMFIHERGRSLGEVAELAEMIARWLENVNDKVRSASHTVESALLAAAEETEGRFAPEFQAFADEMRTYGLDSAGRRLCDKLDHPLADKAVVSLMATRESGGIPIEALSALADAAQSEVNNARRLEAQLARSTTSAQLVTMAGLGLAVIAVVLFRGNLVIYKSLGGQVVLFVGLVLAAGSLWKVWDLARVESSRRYLRFEGRESQ